MESGLRRVGTQDGQDPRSGWWCRKRLCRRYEWVRWKNNINRVIFSRFSSDKHQVIISPACTRGWWVGRTRPAALDSLPHSGRRCSAWGGWSTRPSRWAQSPPTCPPCDTAASGAALLPVQRWLNLHPSPSSSPPCSFCGVCCDCRRWLCLWSHTWSSPQYEWGCTLHGPPGADCVWRRWSSWPGSWLRGVFFFASVLYSWREALHHLQRRSQAPCQLLLRPPVLTLHLPGTASISAGLSR